MKKAAINLTPLVALPYLSHWIFKDVEGVSLFLNVLFIVSVLGYRLFKWIRLNPAKVNGMSQLLPFLFVLIALPGVGQVFYVEPTEKGYEKEIAQKLDFEGYSVTSDKEKAEYILTYSFQRVKSINVGTYEAFIKVHDSKGAPVYVSGKRKKQATAYNGYNAVPSVLRDIMDKELMPKIKSGIAAR